MIRRLLLCAALLALAGCMEGTKPAPLSRVSTAKPPDASLSPHKEANR